MNLTRRQPADLVIAVIGEVGGVSSEKAFTNLWYWFGIGVAISSRAVAQRKRNSGRTFLNRGSKPKQFCLE